MKVIVVGSSHGGYEALEEMLASGKDYDLSWYEKGDYFSFMSWGLHTYLEGSVKDVDTIRYSSAQEMAERGVAVYPETEVVNIDPEKHEIQVKDLRTGAQTTETYDKLILAVGVAPNLPAYEGMDLENIYLYAGRDNAVALKNLADSEAVEDVVVIGGGYIAVEAAISFAKRGKKVTMLNRSDRPLKANLDNELIDILLEEFKDKGINFVPNVNVEKIIGKDGRVSSVLTDQGSFPADLVIPSIGNHPNTAWLKGVLDLNERGHILVNDFMETSAKDVFAVGGATLMKYNPSQDYKNIDLATNARKQGRIAAKNLEEQVFEYGGTQGTSGLRVFDYYFASTGLNGRGAKASNLAYHSVYVERLVLDEYLPKESNAMAHAKLYYDRDSRRILGGQILSKHDLTGLVQALSMAIKGRLTIDDLAFGDFFFQPLFNRPWNLLNVLGLEAQEQEKQ